MQLVLDDNGHEIFGIACCKSCNVAITFKKKENGKERSLGTKNLLDHINNCKPGSRVEVTPKRSVVKQPSVDKERCTSRSNDSTSHCETPLDVVNKQRTISSYMNVLNMSSSAQKRHSQDILNKNREHGFRWLFAVEICGKCPLPRVFAAAHQYWSIRRKNRCQCAVNRTSGLLINYHQKGAISEGRNKKIV